MDEGSGAATSQSAGQHSRGRSLPLKARYGLNAWKRWALSRVEPTDDTKAKDQSKQSEPPQHDACMDRTGNESDLKTLLCLSGAARSKYNLLSLSAEELNVALSRFVREVCRPGGERYSPDSILYLCLGIQQVGNKLHHNGKLAPRLIYL